MLENHRAGLRSITVILVLCMSLAQTTLAQSSADEKKILTLEEAVDFALKNYPAVRASLERVTAAQAGIVLARTNYLPRADVIWQTNRAIDNNITGLLLPRSIIAPISGPVPASTSNQSAWGSAAGLLFSWEPFDFGYRGAKVNAARAVRDQATAEASLTRLDVAVATVNAYLTVLAAQRTLRAAEADVERRHTLAEEIFPSSASTQFRLRIDAPDGTRVAVTEALVQRVLAAITVEAGFDNLDLTLGYVGAQPSSYPINTVFLWTSGPQQAIINVGLKPGASISLRDLEQSLRQKLPQEFPGTHFSFDPGDLISQTLNFGAPSSAEVAITGPQYADVQSYANRVEQELAKVQELRDVEFEEPLRYPTFSVHVDRVLAGQLGATANDVGAAIVSATASSRFIAPNYWRDLKSGVSYQVQVQVPQPAMTSLKDIQTIPVNSSTGTHPLLSQVAEVQSTTVPGELDRQNGLWMIIASANVGNSDFARAAKEIDRAIAKAGQAPRGVTTQIRGQVSALKQIFTELVIGLALAVVVILLLLTANFQSFRLALIVISSAPAVLVGAVLMLLLTGTTLNLESFMGTIMAIGIAVANAILLVTFAEQNRRNGADPVSAARTAATERLRPVLMTSLAMIAGMIPMALAIGQGSEETAPLGRAVIGGLFAATLATLFLLPTVFGVVQKRASLRSPSLDPEDPDSPFAQKLENA